MLREGQPVFEGDKSAACAESSELGGERYVSEQRFL